MTALPNPDWLAAVPGRVVRKVSDDDRRRTRAISAHYLEMAQRCAQGGFPPT